MSISDRMGNVARLSSLDMLVQLTVRRLTLAQDVAAAKFATGQPIEDRIREQRILNSVFCALNGIGRYQELGVQFFRDQIEANKAVQRGLHKRWRAHPQELPVLRRNLAADVRPKFDHITTQMILEFKYMDDVPHLRREDIDDMLDRQFHAEPPLRQIHEFRRDAAAIALRSFVRSS